MHQNSYRRLALMALLSFIAMFILMYAMVDAFGNVYSSLNQVYMAGLMTAPMIVIELLLMGMMYHDKKLNRLLMGIAVVCGALFFGAIRRQTLISDKQFLRSMIPHHGGAILMCGDASIHDPEIKALCEKISVGQKQEIEQMKAILRRLEK